MLWSLITKIFQDPTTRAFKRFHDILAVFILVSTLLVVFETVPDVAMKYVQFFWYAELFFVSFFSIEYLLRFFTDKNPLHYMTSFMGFVDLLAILPTFIILGLGYASPTIRLLRIVRSIRVLRLLRVIRLIRFFGGTKTGQQRIDRAENLLPFVNVEIYFFALFIIITFSASLMYLAESHIPGSSFRTIPDGMWWAITTVTTVGYGDVIPITTAGKIIASITMLSGFALLALLLSVVGPALQVLLFGSRIEVDPNITSDIAPKNPRILKPRKPRVSTKSREIQKTE